MFEPARLDGHVHTVRRDCNAARRIPEEMVRLFGAPSDGVEPYQRAVTSVGDPDLAPPHGDVLRFAPDGNRLVDRYRKSPRVDPGHRAVRAIRHPDGVGAHRDGARLATDGDSVQNLASTGIESDDARGGR